MDPQVLAAARVAAWGAAAAGQAKALRVLGVAAPAEDRWASAERRVSRETAAAVRRRAAAAVRRRAAAAAADRREPPRVSGDKPAGQREGAADRVAVGEPASAASPEE